MHKLESTLLGFALCMLWSCKVVVSPNTAGVPQYRRPNTVILLIGSPKRVPGILGSHSSLACAKLTFGKPGMKEWIRIVVPRIYPYTTPIYYILVSIVFSIILIYPPNILHSSFHFLFHSCIPRPKVRKGPWALYILLKEGRSPKPQTLHLVAGPGEKIRKDIKPGLRKRSIGVVYLTYYWVDAESQVEPSETAPALVVVSSVIQILQPGSDS